MTLSQYWTDHAAGAITKARFEERACYLASIAIEGSGMVIYWTDDGTAGGTNLFDATRMPWVKPMMQDVNKDDEFTNRGHFGNMMVTECSGSVDQFMHFTELKSGVWATEVWLGAPASEGGETQSGRGRVAHVYATGKGA